LDGRAVFNVAISTAVATAGRFSYHAGLLTRRVQILYRQIVDHELARQ
jgi:hypothetical protein